MLTSTRRFPVVLALVVPMMLLATTRPAFSQTCTFLRTANSDTSASPVNPPQKLQSGDFIVVGLPGNSGEVGDGKDEFTRWIYDYKDDLDIIEKLDPTKLATAKLDVVFQGGGSNDDIGIHGLTQFLAFPNGIQADQSYNLLTKYTPVSIITKIMEAQSSGSTGVTAQEGELLMGFQDDATVMSASLELVFDQECPAICTTSKSTASELLVNWKNETGGAFADGSNWEGNRPPGPDSIAVFGIGGKSYSVTVDAPKSNSRLDADGDFSILQLNENKYELTGATRDLPGGGCSLPESIVVYGKAGRSSGLVISNGPVLASGNVIVGTGGLESAMLTVTGDSARLSVLGGTSTQFKIGDGPGSNGSLLVELGGKVESDGVELFASDPTSSGSITVSGPGSSWTAIFSTLGGLGTANSRIEEGASATIGTFALATGDGSSAALVVSDSGSVLTIENEMNVGTNGDGTVTVEDKASIMAGPASFVRLGQGSFGDGRLRVLGSGSTFDSEGVVQVGTNRTGSFEVADGATAVMSNLEVARLDSGHVSIDGPSTSFTITDNIVETKVGQNGGGRIDITNGASIESAGDLHIGAEPVVNTNSGLGVMRVFGPRSIASARNIFIGVKSVGEMYVDSAIVSLSQGIAVGTEDFGQDITPSRLELAHGAEIDAANLTVGNGTGVVRIRSGSAIGVQDAVVARSDTSDGKIFVEDPGSELIVVGRLVLGDLGTALLNVFSGGSARIGTLKVGPGGTIIGSNLTVQKRISKTEHERGAGPDEIETEALYLSEGAVLNVSEVNLGDGGVLGGSGSYPFPLVNGGEISPGDAVGTTGILQLDSSYVQLESGSLRIELGGEDEFEFDRLEVNGTAELAGKLIIDLIDIPDIDVGAGLEIVSADSISGTFSEVIAGPGLAVDIEYTATTVTVRITAPVSVEDDGGDEIARTFHLDANYPNPFSESTSIPYSLPEAAHVEILVVDLLGRIVRNLDLGMKQSGDHVFSLRRNGLPAGVYHLRMTAGSFSATQKTVLLR